MMYRRVFLNLLKRDRSLSVCHCGYTNKRCLSTTSKTSADIRKKRNQLFTEEQKRQQEDVGRIEKIEVQYVGLPEDVTLMMNKGISTPYNCAQHMSEMLMNRSALALLNGSRLWDMHRPLDSDCQLELLHFKCEDPYHVNKAFWRSCSMLLGVLAENIFKDDIPVSLHSFPSPNVKTGSFVYDVDIGLDNWQPSQDELRILSSQMVRFCHNNHRFERLEVSTDLALEMFEDNKYKTEQIPLIASQISEGRSVILYRVGDHIDLSRGPMIADTSFIGRCTITAVHRIETDYGNLYRFQGIALPKDIMLNHYAYGIIEKRAKKLNSGRFPTSPSNTPDIFQPTSDALAA